MKIVSISYHEYIKRFFDSKRRFRLWEGDQKEPVRRVPPIAILKVSAAGVPSELGPNLCTDINKNGSIDLRITPLRSTKSLNHVC